MAIVIIALVQPRFLSFDNLANVIGQSAPLEIFALAQLLPLLARGLDLSQGGIVVMTSVAFALMASVLGTDVAAVLAIFVGAAAGLVNGLFVSGLHISPFVVTLGTGSILQGLALIAGNGQPVSNVPPSFPQLFRASIGIVPLPLATVIILAVVVAYVLAKVRYGRYVYAVGSNERAALLSGIPVQATTVGAYATAGALTSIGAVLLASRISSGHPTVGSDTALRAVAAAVIGGVSLFGGRGTVVGALLGALFLGLLANALNLINVSSFLQQVAIGIAIIAAAALDRWRLGAKAS
jgi:ribose/xylose/arabinose/galactoside ABC-type transport system permease subunit